MKDNWTKDWIISHAIEICDQYEKGILTLRALHYQLVGKGMTNDIQHYKRVVTSMIDARWARIIDFDVFSDLDRVMVGETQYQQTILEDQIDNASKQVKAWMTSYHKNRWENQPYYPEIFIEKKALQGVFTKICNEWDVALGACKGYPSLTFLHEAYLRFQDAKNDGKKPIIIYFGDYDPSGEDIPRSIQENIERFGINIEVKRFALMEDQVVKWNLPPAPAKLTDTRTAKWEGLGQVELDAVKPEMLVQLCKNAIEEVFDEDLYDDLLKTQSFERVKYKKRLQEFVNTLKD
jgi:hypothetical protein